MRDLTGIVEYEPGDLTLTARTGTTLAEIARATAEHGQWFALDPVGDPSRATLGATIATGSYGPLAHHFGTPRDMTLGVELVTGVGDIVRGGGRVVKNVAGFDLTRLVTGSWGTLAVITEATVRLRALPAVSATVAIELARDVQDLERLRAGLRRLPFTPLAATLLDRTAVSRVDIGSDGDVLLLRLGGNEEAVTAQRSQLDSLGITRQIDESVWQRLRVLEPATAAVMRLSRLPSRIAETWREAGLTIHQWPGAYRQADLGRGVVRIVLPLGSEAHDASLAALLDVAYEGNRIFERLPGPLWNTLAPSAMHGRIDRGIKTAFDPHHILNPGIFGESQ
jgi:glycolate oxidase FAD binding subunit